MKKTLIKIIKALLSGLLGDSESYFICNCIALIAYITIGILGGYLCAAINTGIFTKGLFLVCYQIITVNILVETLIDNWDKVK